MKKRLVAVFGIMLMTIGVFALPFGLVNAKTIEEARSECEAKNGTFRVSQVYSDGTFSSSCALPASSGGGVEYNSGSGGASVSPSDDDKTYGSNENDSGTTWVTDNSQAKSDNGCNGDGVKTNLFGDGCVSGTDGIFAVLNVILNVLTWGVGIAGTIGIVITGITYMTAKDDVAQMTKAKNRLIQIIIGLVVYAVMWGFLQWLLPGGVFGN